MLASKVLTTEGVNWMHWQGKVEKSDKKTGQPKSDVPWGARGMEAEQFEQRIWI